MISNGQNSQTFNTQYINFKLFTKLTNFKHNAISINCKQNAKYTNFQYKIYLPTSKHKNTSKFIDLNHNVNTTNTAELHNSRSLKLKNNFPPINQSQISQ